MMKKLLIYLLLGISLMACKESDDETGAAKPNVKNMFRVKEITGSNAYWGNYTMTVSYYEEVVDSALICNSSKDTIAYLSSEDTDNGIKYIIYDLVPNIDADSIRHLEELYGAKAKDSIPMVSRKLFSVDAEYAKEQLQSQAFEWYRPREDVGTGEDFNNQYLKDRKTKYIYEYTPEGNLSICRMAASVYDTSDPDNNDEFKGSVYKLVFGYAGGRVSMVEKYKGEEQFGSADSYVKTDSWNFVYAGERLSAVGGISYQYDGNSVSITQEGSTVRYTCNGDGYLTRIDYGNGEYLEVKYESGNGNFSLLTPFFEGDFGIPFIR